MAGTDIKLTSSGGGEFDSYVVTPDGGPAPGIVMVADVFGVGPSLKAICDELGEAGYAVSAPDFFWRTDLPGPLELGDERARERAQPRYDLIEKGIEDVADAANDLKSRPECNGKVAVAGFCYGGPYAYIGPARMGLDAGFSYHGSAMQDWYDDIAGIKAPVSIHFGTDDHAAPQEVLDQIQDAADGNDLLELHLYPDVKHGYTSRHAPAWDAAAYEASMTRTKEILNALR